MATSDLQGELAKDNFKTDGETEKKLCHVILQQVDDSSGDISGLAVKWYVHLQFGLLLQLATSSTTCESPLNMNTRAVWACWCGRLQMPDCRT